MNFLGESICSSNRHDFFQEGLLLCSSNRHKFFRRVYRKDMFFQGGSICSSNIHYYFIEQTLILTETLIYTSNTYEFSRSLYFLIEQILIFQETISSPRHIRFSRRLLCLEQRSIFQKGTLCQTDISAIDLSGCLQEAFLAHQTDTIF